MEQKVTTIEELLEYKKGQFVQLPDFAENMPFFARLRRPSLMTLVKTGKIPNSLIATANRLFNGKGMDDEDKEAMPAILDILENLCEATFVEPSYKDIKEAGIELTDQQLMAVFNYTQEGIKALEPFRGQPKCNGTDVHVADVPVQAVGNTWNY